MYGWRARLGVLVPSKIIATEPDLRLMTPEGVSCHFTRIAFEGGGVANLKKVEAGVEEATRLIMHVRPNAMCMAGTGVSFVGGYGYDQMLIKRMKEVNGNLPTTTTTTAVIEALKRIGVKRVSVGMPYLEEVAKVAVQFVKDSGIEVLDMKWLGRSLDIGDIPRETVYKLAQDVDRPESEAVFLSCTNLHTLEVIEKLECDLGKPVVTSNQATMWHLLRLAGINDKIEGYGRLLSEY